MPVYHFIRRSQELRVSESETMRSIIILLFACLALAALADDNASNLEKTDEDSPVNLSEGIDKLSGRQKREENPLLVFHQRTRRRQPNGKNSQKPDDLGMSLGAGGGGPGHVVRVEEGEVTWCGWRRARSRDTGGGGRGHLVRVEEGQVTWCVWRRARSLGAGGGGPGHMVRVEEGRIPKQTEMVGEPGRRKGGRLRL
ncbi:hypothetical protein LSAT2_022724 [Lamellibrachia satsuma]|nr:hypothetical protein LSAT2_022724 [Lamellibrachia satsuma]